MSGFPAETILGETVQIVDKIARPQEGDILVAEDGTQFVRDTDNFGLLVMVEEPVEVAPQSEATQEEAGQEPDTSAAAATEEPPAAPEEGNGAEEETPPAAEVSSDGTGEPETELSV